jgi:CRP-like cAMP-binding protein
MAKDKLPKTSLPKGELKELIAKLGALPRFADCSKGDLELLARSAALSAVPAHWPLINEQTPADACYVVLDGEVDVVIDQKPVVRLGPGSVVGETGLFESRLRNATVVSVSRVTVLHLTPEVFQSLVSLHPAIRTALQGPAKADG